MLSQVSCGWERLGWLLPGLHVVRSWSSYQHFEGTYCLYVQCRSKFPLFDCCVIFCYFLLRSERKFHSKYSKCPSWAVVPIPTCPYMRRVAAISWMESHSLSWSTWYGTVTPFGYLLPAFLRLPLATISICQAAHAELKLQPLPCGAGGSAGWAPRPSPCHPRVTRNVEEKQRK
jgi:hypothetical protein